MKSQKIYLFRHGEPSSEILRRYIGHSDISLSKKGKEQALKINEFIRQMGGSKVVTSDLKRTFSELTVEFSKEEGFREINFGKWEGLSWNEIEERFPTESKNFLKKPKSFVFPSGESSLNFLQRVSSSFDDVLKRYNGNFVFVVHAGVIKAVISEKLGIPLRKVFDFRIDYGKCTILEKSNNHFSLVSLNTDI